MEDQRHRTLQLFPRLFPLVSHDKGLVGAVDVALYEQLLEMYWDVVLKQLPEGERWQVIREEQAELKGYCDAGLLKCHRIRLERFLVQKEKIAAAAKCIQCCNLNRLLDERFLAFPAEIQALIKRSKELREAYFNDELERFTAILQDIDINLAEEAERIMESLNPVCCNAENPNDDSSPTYSQLIGSFVGDELLQEEPETEEEQEEEITQLPINAVLGCKSIAPDEIWQYPPSIYVIGQTGAELYRQITMLTPDKTQRVPRSDGGKVCMRLRYLENEYTHPQPPGAKDNVLAHFEISQPARAFLISWETIGPAHPTWELEVALKHLPGFQKVLLYGANGCLSSSLGSQAFPYDCQIERILCQREISPEDLNSSLSNVMIRRHAEEGSSSTIRYGSFSDASDGFSSVKLGVPQPAIERFCSSMEYLVKWKGLSYCDATWEVIEDMPGIKNVLETEERALKSKTQQYLRFGERPAVFEQFYLYRPDFLGMAASGLELRPHQIQGVNVLLNNWWRRKNTILADSLGLGKTIQAVAFIAALRYEYGVQGPFLIICPLSIIPAWMDTFQNWLGYMPALYIGSHEDRRIAARHLLYEQTAQVIITTPDTALNDIERIMRVKWRLLCVDEAHLLKSNKTQRYKAFREIVADATLLITATPVSNTLTELQTMLEFVDPGAFQGREKLFEKIDPTQLQAAITKYVAVPAELVSVVKLIRPYIIRRDSSQAKITLPPKTEYRVEVELSQDQIALRETLISSAKVSQTDSVRSKKCQNLLMQLKKVCAHVALFPRMDMRVEQMTAEDIIGPSDKMRIVSRFLKEFNGKQQKVLIFTQFLDIVKLLQRLCVLLGFKYNTIVGTQSIDERQAEIDAFKRGGFVFLISTRAGGQGINLQDAPNVIIYDSDWNPQVDEQAIGRSYRIGQKHAVAVYRLISKDSVEEHILNVAANKLILNETFAASVKREVTTADELMALLQHGRSSFAKNGEK